MKLLIDIGNTRLKWAWSRDGQFIEHGAAIHDGAPARVLAALPARAAQAVWIAHVTGRDHEPLLTEAVRAHYAQAPRFARSSAVWQGLRNAYREPERLGIDRWLAMIATWQMQRGPACVVDAGTALTVDVIGGDGQHLGGIIAAGFETQQRAVLGATRFAVREANSQNSAALGSDTESCVRQGALLACVGAIEQVARRADRAARLLLSGGDAAILQTGLGDHWHNHPHLVLEGLDALSAG